MRLFIAFGLPVSLTDAIAEVSERLRSDIEGRFVRADNLHITLAFLGQTDEARMTDIAGVVESACEGIGPFRIALGDLGYFGRRKQATLWQGLEKTPVMFEVAERLRDGLRAAGIDFDDKPFSPHVTLARKAALGGVDLGRYARDADGVVDSVTLFESVLTPQGARYIPHAVIAL